MASECLHQSGETHDVIGHNIHATSPLFGLSVGLLHFDKGKLQQPSRDNTAQVPDVLALCLVALRSQDGRQLRGSNGWQRYGVAGLNMAVTI